MTWTDKTTGSPPGSPCWSSMRRKVTAWPNIFRASGRERSSSRRPKASLSRARCARVPCFMLDQTPFNLGIGLRSARSYATTAGAERRYSAGGFAVGEPLSAMPRWRRQRACQLTLRSQSDRRGGKLRGSLLATYNSGYSPLQAWKSLSANLLGPGKDRSEEGGVPRLRQGKRCDPESPTRDGRRSSTSGGETPGAGSLRSPSVRQMAVTIGNSPLR